MVMPRHTRSGTPGDTNLAITELLHDLRSPLSTLEITAALLANREDLPTEVVPAVRRLQSATHEIVLLARRAFELGCTDRATAAEDAEYQRVELATICERVVDQLRVQHPGRPVHVEGDRPIVGRWHPRPLVQIVQNLVGNALEHGSGAVRVELQRTPLEATVRVSHGGPAIPPAALERMFEPFRSGDGGSGLGLHIVREATEIQGGTIEARSTSRETVFEVHLPRGLL